MGAFLSLDVLAQLVVSGLLLGGLYSLVSAGLTLIFGVTRIVNFAHGSALMLGGYAAVILQKTLGLDPLVSLAIVAPLFLLGGMGLEVAMVRPLRKRGATALAVAFATIGLSVVLESLVALIWTSDFQSAKSIISGQLSLGPVHVASVNVAAFVVALAISLIFYLFLRSTHTGRALRALSQDRIGARVVGLNHNLLYALSFGIATACAGVAGTLLSPFFPLSPFTGTHFMILTFVVWLIGEMGGVPGALLGGLLIGMVESLSTYYIGASYGTVIYLMVSAAVLWARPSGLFGASGSEDYGFQ